MESIFTSHIRGNNEVRDIDYLFNVLLKFPHFKRRRDGRES